jgi:hypothetical protein
MGGGRRPARRVHRSRVRGDPRSVRCTTTPRTPPPGGGNPRSRPTSGAGRPVAVSRSALGGAG